MKLFHVDPFATNIFPGYKPNAKDYLESLGTDRAHEIAIETLGAERLKGLLKETADYVKEESKVGMGVNDKV